MRAALCVLVMLGSAVLGVSAQAAVTCGPTTAVAAETTSPFPETCDAEISAECPEVDGETPVILADPSDCGKFCECSEGVAISLVCGPGTLYDETLSSCAPASDVDCGDRPVDD